MALSDLTITVEVVRRPWLSRLARFPFVARGHYRLLRSHGVGRIVAAYGAWRLAGLIVQVGK